MRKVTQGNEVPGGTAQLKDHPLAVKGTSHVSKTAHCPVPFGISAWPALVIFAVWSCNVRATRQLCAEISVVRNTLPKIALGGPGPEETVLHYFGGCFWVVPFDTLIFGPLRKP